MALFGANWRSTLWGGLQAIFTAAVMGTLSFPANWGDAKQVSVFAVAVLGTFFGLKFASIAKDKTVTGGTTQQTVAGNTAEPGTQTLVDATVKASIASNEPVTPEQRKAANS